MSTIDPSQFAEPGAHSAFRCRGITFQGNLAEVFQQAADWCADPRNEMGNVFAVQLDKLDSSTGFTHDAEQIELVLMTMDEPHSA